MSLYKVTHAHNPIPMDINMQYKTTTSTFSRIHHSQPAAAAAAATAEIRHPYRRSEDLAKTAVACRSVLNLRTKATDRIQKKSFSSPSLL
jgi:hypothetical protein